MPVFLVLQTSSIRSPFRRRLPWTSGAAFTAPALLLPAAPRSSPGYEPFSVSSVVVCFSIFKLWGLWCVSFTSLWVFMWFGTWSGRFVGLGHICLFLKKMYNGSKEITSSLWEFGRWEHEDSFIHHGVIHNDESCANKSSRATSKSASCLNSLIMLLVTRRRPCNNWNKFLLSISW